ncbi:MAG TPA: recombinase family protein [Bryobacteraceae bacterium]|nr:recombinase family protein [Bryobacteraceae bacterium]
MSAVLYARVSSKDQEREGFSIPAQLQLLRGYAASRGLTVLKEFVDVETAKQAGRTGFGEMLAFLRKDKTCRILLVEKTDRLYRNLKDWVTLDELDLEIHLVKENIVISQDSRSSEKFMHGIKVLMAKNYIDNLSEETKKGMFEKARQGIWPSYAPLGYLNVMGADGKRTIAPNPELAPIIRRMFERYATGHHSLKVLAKLARQDGLQYPKSKLPVPTSTVHKILRNRIYSGDFDFDGKTHAGKYEAIVTRELWQEVQDRLDGRSRQKPRKARHEFAFSNLIRCGHCGCAMVGELKKQQYVYYHCSRYKGRCPEPYTREEVLEKRFSELLRRLTFPKDVWNGSSPHCAKATTTRRLSTTRPSDGSRPNTAASRTASTRCTWTSWTAGSTTPFSTASQPSGARSRTASCATSRRTSPPTASILRKVSNSCAWPAAPMPCSRGRNRRKNGAS